MQNLTNSSKASCEPVKCDHGDPDGCDCWCDWGWFGESCDIEGSSEWGSSWDVFKILFTILYFLLFAISSFKLYQTLNQDKIVGTKRLIYRLFRSPKNLCLLFLVCASILRGLWLVIDPYSFKSIANRTVDRLLYETVYPFLYGLYSSVLLVWGGLYQGMKSKRSDPFKIFRGLIMAMMIIAFPTSIIISILKGQRVSSEGWMSAAIVFVASGVFILIVGFVLFGVLLYKYIEKNTSSGEPYIHESPVPLEFTEYKDMEPREEIGIHRSRSRVARLSLAPIKRLSVINNEHEVSWEAFIEEESEGEESKMSERFYFEEENLEPKKKVVSTTDNMISLITVDDKKIFHKLCALLMLSTGLGVLVLVFLVILAKSVSGISDNQMEVMYCVFFIELFSFWFIYLVFTAQIKVKDKEYLRFFTFLSLKMNKKLPKIKYPSSMKKIGTRLHNFYS